MNCNTQSITRSINLELVELLTEKVANRLIKMARGRGIFRTYDDEEALSIAHYAAYLAVMQSGNDATFPIAYRRAIDEIRKCRYGYRLDTSDKPRPSQFNNTIVSDDERSVLSSGVGPCLSPSSIEDRGGSDGCSQDYAREVLEELISNYLLTLNCIRTKKSRSRNEAILRGLLDGQKMEAIGMRYGLTLSRVSQIYGAFVKFCRRVGKEPCHA
jgi:hypothetical protein